MELGPATRQGGEVEQGQGRVERVQQLLAAAARRRSRVQRRGKGNEEEPARDPVTEAVEDGAEPRKQRNSELGSMAVAASGAWRKQRSDNGDLGAEGGGSAVAQGASQLGGRRRGWSIGELLSLAKRGGDRKMEGIKGEKSEGDGALGLASGGARGEDEGMGVSWR